MPALKYLRVFCCLLLLLFVFVEHYFFVCLKRLCLLYIFLGKIISGNSLRIVIKVHLSGQNLLFLCHEPMSTTSLSSFNNTFLKRLIISVCFWTTWVIWIWAANPREIVYLPVLILKVQLFGAFQPYERLHIRVPT